MSSVIILLNGLLSTTALEFMTVITVYTQNAFYCDECTVVQMQDVQLQPDVLCAHSFSTDDDNDTEVEAIDVDTELSLVTECWVEPQSGTVCSSLDQHQHLQNLTYQEIPQAVSHLQHITEILMKFYCTCATYQSFRVTYFLLIFPHCRIVKS